jgi:precorrin-6A/cobalt-precorrin-6A reductase
MFREDRADYVVMKNSGQKGGTSEKIAACRQLGIKPVVIERGTETGFTDLDELVAFVLRS